MIDTATKRASVLSFALAAITLVVPQSGVPQGDQQTICDCYSGILAATPPPPPPPPPVAPVAPANYDLLGAIDVLMPGIVIQANLVQAAWNAWSAKGFAPLTASDVPGILAAANALVPVQTILYPTTEGGYPLALPPYPAGLPRIPDSNPDPIDGWVKYGPEGPGVV